MLNGLLVGARIAAVEFFHLKAETCTFADDVRLGLGFVALVKDRNLRVGLCTIGTIGKKLASTAPVQSWVQVET